MNLRRLLSTVLVMMTIIGNVNGSEIRSGIWSLDGDFDESAKVQLYENTRFTVHKIDYFSVNEEIVFRTGSGYIDIASWTSDLPIHVEYPASASTSQRHVYAESSRARANIHWRLEPIEGKRVVRTGEWLYRRRAPYDDPIPAPINLGEGEQLIFLSGGSSSLIYRKPDGSLGQNYSPGSVAYMVGSYEVAVERSLDGDWWEVDWVVIADGESEVTPSSMTNLVLQVQTTTNLTDGVWENTLKFEIEVPIADDRYFKLEIQEAP